ncbi:uncharacterized protein PFL1_06549 [Pseudozyma flocculosa PF-1]|uniref:Xanthine dehydrogenase n=1 Tax=Pseudozyma flocculosa PF-1 TaxID=1277687 RepID=A0A061H265_9BASI|nr:uncharacterized protein PFL1_06549 [Pseudozyma flocculosa PF-1]EPQ25875.1 hypothetical protein PFL1_06549 [Pseudozyma flocculosa PF-1]
MPVPVASSSVAFETRSVEGFTVPASFEPASRLTFTVNRTRYQLSAQRGDDLDVTLLDFVRSKGFTGTKLGCGEGGCGACTVVVGRRKASSDSIDPAGPAQSSAPYRYKSVNACLLPLVAVHGCHVLTVEGIGSSSDPHPIQERIGKMFGSQCGFCTPGIVMSLYATVRNGYGNLSEEDIEHSLDGCLCRCTGYRPILDAAKTFATVKKSRSEVEPSASSSSSSSGSPSSAPSTPANGNGSDSPVTTPDEDDGEQDDVMDLAMRQGCPKGDECCQVKGGGGGGGCGAKAAGDEHIHTTREARQMGFDRTTFKPYEPRSEPIFPPYLAKGGAAFDAQDLVFVEELAEPDEDAYEGDELEERRRLHADAVRQVWLRPGSLESLVRCMALYADAGAKIRSGNTETGIEVKFKHLRYKVSIFVSDHIRQLATYRADDAGLSVGANLPLTDLVQRLRAERTEAGSYRRTVQMAIMDNLRYFASNQIRNVATLAGNIATASPISDLNPIWVAVGATLYYIDPAADGPPLEERSVNMRDFFLGYRKTALPPGAILTRLFVPWADGLGGDGDRRTCTFIHAFKQSKRKDDDIAIVNGCLRISIDARDRTITDATLAYGGMGPTTMQSRATQQLLVGKRFADPATLDEALDCLSRTDFPLSYGVPGGMPVYRKSLALGFLARFWGIVHKELAQRLGEGGEADATKTATAPATGSAGLGPWTSARLEEMAASTLTRPVTHGSQDFEDVAVKQPPVGSSMPHLSAMKQVTGEAVYIDDMPPVADELHAGLVLSQRAHARLVSVDASEALRMPGVVDYITRTDIPAAGSNIWNPPAMDEVFFAEDEVHCVGQLIGVVVAGTKKQAQAAARKVRVEYEDLPHILTIDEAIAADSFFRPRPVIHRGCDASEPWQQERGDGGGVLEGETRMGGQEHFYLETNACLVVPGREDSEVEVFSSTQNPSETQIFCASILGVPNNRVVTRTKRLGGGFGGKETRTIALAAPLTLAAKKVGRPVRCMLDRDEDMLTSGQRHPFHAKWKVAFAADGRLERLEARVYNNGGWSQDLSQAILERAMFHIDNCYNIPHLRVEGRICRTHTMSNTAFRGFGGPQGMFICEDIVSKVAARLAMRPEAIRERNLYAEGDATHFGQKLVDWNVPALWDQVKRQGDYEARRAAVDRFNAEHRFRKRGLALVPTKFGISFTALMLNQASALIHVYHHDGSVLFSHGGTEMGQGLHTKMAQVVATELGIDIGMVHLMETNTSHAANTSATAASASSDLNGMALKDACDQLNARLAPFRDAAAAGPDGLRPDEAWKKAVHDAYFARVPLSAVGHYKTPDIGYNWATGTGRPFFLLYPGRRHLRGRGRRRHGRLQDLARRHPHGHWTLHQPVDRRGPD